MKRGVRVAGIMCGTSLDGIDVAIVDIAEVAAKAASVADRASRGPTLAVKTVTAATLPLGLELRDTLVAVMPPKPGSTREISVLNRLVGDAFADALMQLAGPIAPLDSIDLVGTHGVTVYHAPVDDGKSPFAPSTLQIGDAAAIAVRTSITCVADFRTADVAAGGQGAPLASYVDALLLRDVREDRVALNIGGIANVTILPASGTVTAFDTGPGNMLIDAFARSLTKGRQRFDTDGALAVEGRPHERLLAKLLDHPYYRREPPKSAGREQFGGEYVDQVSQLASAEGCSGADLMATITALTAATIASSIPHGCKRVIASGGGVHNRTLMEMLRARLNCPLMTSDAFGLDPDAKEAIVFAVLAYQAACSEPNTLPSCTGARTAVIGGKIAPGSNYAALMRKLAT